VEAGLRCYDMSMPEEVNRILIDHCATYLFAPTEQAKKNLLRENISKDRIYVTGNTIVDVVRDYPQGIFSGGHYILLTLHRQENVDSADRFLNILKGIDLIHDKFKVPIIYPVHPRSKKMMNKFGFETVAELIEPLDYFGFLKIETNACLVLTDSGGVQEEACILGVPCVTLRDNTERPETVKVGANIIAGTLPDNILKCVEIMLNKGNDWKQPYGDGNSGKKTVEIIRRHYG